MTVIAAARDKRVLAVFINIIIPFRVFGFLVFAGKPGAYIVNK